ncbi:Golgi apparatus membrane protein TVP18 [Myxozyma melibiosi]|uniref:Golgi apparatus membrane protein TVP18 n=1 Tax=Myxozyma melibiosi TaxID=54550 RepID=A0ABR1EXS6_9ASCO
MTVMEELRTRNFSLYGQWIGILSILICLAVGIATIFTFNVGLIIFSAVCIATGLTIIFVEVPFLLRVCPISGNFEQFVQKFNNNIPRGFFYLGLALIQWFTLFIRGSSLIVAAVFLTITSACYFLAAAKKQEFTTSTALGGQGMAQQII